MRFHSLSLSKPLKIKEIVTDIKVLPEIPFYRMPAAAENTSKHEN